MPIGPFSPCPGGVDKKIKFCCGKAFQAELQQIEQMLDGKQYQACQNYLDSLEKKHPQRACLLATKSLLLRIADRLEDAHVVAKTFLENHPENPFALAEMAVTSSQVSDDIPASLGFLFRALAACEGNIPRRVYEAITVTSRMLAVRSYFLAARALALLQSQLHSEDERPLGLLMNLDGAPAIPLLFKGNFALQSCPKDNVPWKEGFDAALATAHQVRWHVAVDRFAELAQQNDQEPAIWYNLALLRAWTADIPGCIEAFKKFASLEVPLDDAVEARALAMLLSDDALGDQLDLTSLTYTVEAADPLLEGFRASDLLVEVPSDANERPVEGPPPMAAFAILKRPPSPESAAADEKPATTEDAASEEAESADTADSEEFPELLAVAQLFGKQTDREARLEVEGVNARDLDTVKALLATESGSALGSEPTEQVIGSESITQHLINRNWLLPHGVSSDTFRDVTTRQIDQAVIERWPEAPLGLFDGKSPREIAAQNAGNIDLLAAILVVETWLESAGARFDGNRLRSELGVPVLERFEPGEQPINLIPPRRLAWVQTDYLSDENLVAAFLRSLSIAARDASTHFAKSVIGRPALIGRDERFQALQHLAQQADDLTEMLGYIDQGRNEAVSVGQSSASWDLVELSVHLERRDPAQFSRMLQHLYEEHREEPGVAQDLSELLADAGLLGPDGQLAVPQAAAAQEEPGLVVPGQEEAEPGKLWTPESQKPADDDDPKIWTPGDG